MEFKELKKIVRKTYQDERIKDVIERRKNMKRNMTKKEQDTLKNKLKKLALNRKSL